MAYLLLDDDFHDHPKTWAAGNEAAGLQLRAMSWCGKHLTDGHVPTLMDEKWALSPSRGKRVRERLLEVGYRDPCQVHPDCTVIHNYLERNPSREQVEAKRKAANERKRKARQKSPVTALSQWDRHGTGA